MRRRLSRSLHVVVATLTLGAFARVAAGADTYRFDPVHTQVWFSVDHERFSRPQGRLRVASGLFVFDDDDWRRSRVDVTIDLTSLDMGDAKWNDTVTSGQFLDSARYPTARYISRSVERTSRDAGVIHGDLYLRGAKKPIDLAFTRNRVGTDPYLFKRKAGFSATARLSRAHFGMRRYAEVVGDDVDLRLEIEGVADNGATPAPPPPLQTIEESSNAAQE